MMIEGKSDELASIVSKSYIYIMYPYDCALQDHLNYYYLTI